jgi:8-oxo-dGTP diphosphatase
MDQPRVGVGVMIVRDDHVLMAQRARGRWAGWYGWIGGKLEFGESLHTCARREAREEAGVEIEHLRLLCLSSIVMADQHWIDVEFLADLAGGEPRTIVPDEIGGWAWWPIDQLPSPIFEPAQKALEAYKSGTLLNDEI